MANGTAVFKQNVKTLLDEGLMKRKKVEKKRKADETLDVMMENVLTNGLEDLHQEETIIEDQSSWKEKYEELVVKYDQLQEENLKLIKEINMTKKDKDTKSKEPEKTEEKENKRRRCTTNGFIKGEKVMAFWRDEITGEESWQEAMVVFAYSDGKCRVQWLSDGMISTAKLHEVQKLN